MAATSIAQIDEITSKAGTLTAIYSDFEQSGFAESQAYFAGTYFAGDPKALKSDIEDEQNFEQLTDVFVSRPEAVLSSSDLGKTDSPTWVDDDGKKQIEALPTWSRLDHILSILLRSESLELIKLVDEGDQTRIQQFIFESDRNLQTFADFVFQGLLVTRERTLCFSRIAERMIDQVAAI